MVALSDQERRGFLRDEYLLLQNHYEDFDRRSLTIKGWIATGAAAALGISFSSSNRYAYFVPILVAILTAAFWYLEAYWKVFQAAIGDRIRIIEAYFRQDKWILEKNPSPFQAFHQFAASYKQHPELYEKDEGRRQSKLRRLEETGHQELCLHAIRGNNFPEYGVVRPAPHYPLEAVVLISLKSLVLFEALPF